MTSLFDKLNLRPNERRMVVIVSVIIFFALNWIWVWPHFADWQEERASTRKARDLISLATNEISRLKSYQQKLEVLQGEAGVIDLNDRPDVEFSKNVVGLLKQAGITSPAVDSPRLSSSLENSFFEEYSLTVTINKTSPEALKQFLVSLVNSDSLMRVQELAVNLSPDRMGLRATVRIVGSFQKPSPGAEQSAVTSTTAQTKK